MTFFFCFFYLISVFEIFCFTFYHVANLWAKLFCNEKAVLSFGEFTVVVYSTVH
jgi:hypothetical protein